MIYAPSKDLESCLILSELAREDVDPADTMGTQTGPEHQDNWLKEARQTQPAAL